MDAKEKVEIIDKYGEEVYKLREHLAAVMFNLNYVHEPELTGFSRKEMDLLADTRKTLAKIVERLHYNVVGEENIIAYERKRKIDGIIKDIDNE